MQKRGVSGVITSILIVLIVLVAVAVVYNVVVPIVQRGSFGIENQTGGFISNLFSNENNSRTNNVNSEQNNINSGENESEQNPASENCANCPRGNAWCEGADINRDYKIDSNDYDILDKWYLFHKNEINPCSADNKWCNGSDINRDRRIDANDYDILDKWYLFHKNETCSVGLNYCVSEVCVECLNNSNCLTGQECADNQCVEESVPIICTDSDGGKNYYVKGAATSTVNTGQIFENLVDNCSGTTLQEGYCYDDVPEADYDYYLCPNGCEDGMCAEEISGNQKNMALYSEKETFLISDKNWKDVLPFISAAIWTSNSTEELTNCQKGYDTPEDVCVYPFLIYHEEEGLVPILSETPSYAEDDNPEYKPVYSINDKSLVRFYLEGKSKEEFLKQDIDVANIGEDYVDIILTNRQKDYFEESGYNLETIPINSYNPFKDEQQSYEEGLDYHSYESMSEELNILSEDYSDIARLYEIGKSIENRSIWAMKISDNPDLNEDETEILVAGNHHAREIMTVEVPMFMINYLLKNYDSDTEIKKTVDNHELWFVPMVNPDGHVKVEVGDIWWRKNTRDNNNDSTIDYNDGVDLNRNYGFTWGYDDIGSSPEPSSESYRGTDAFSEPETQAIRNLVLENNFTYVLDYHSTAGVILYPWGHIDEPTPDDIIFRNLADSFKKFLPDYTVGQIIHVMYSSNGDSIDWDYGEQTEKNKIFAFGIELDSAYGFNPPESEIKPVSEKQLFVLLNLTGYPIRIDIKQKFDADSSIHFLQQYSPSNLKIIGETPLELDNLLISAPDLGAGLNPNQIQRINYSDYLDYWETYEGVVYVQNNYELALLASTYASLINAPLVIEGTANDNSAVFSEKKVICIGSVVPIGNSCSENYTFEELQKKYLDLTKSTNIILLNPDDLQISAFGSLNPQKTSDTIHELYSKTSLASPILASAKHEIILPDKTKDYQQVDDNIKNFFESNYQEEITSCLSSDSCASGFENTPVNMNGARGSITIFLGGNTDLAITEISSNPIFVNSINNISITIKNIGFDKAENVVLEIYEINESGGGISVGGGGGSKAYSSYSQEFILIDTLNIGEILEDESEIAKLMWTPTKVGDATLFLNVSTSSNESNLNNNNRFFHTRVSGPQPDISIVETFPTGFLVDSLNRFNITITNTGTQTSESIQVNFYEVSWESGSRILKLIDTSTISSLDVNDIRDIEFEFTPTKINYHDFFVEALTSNDINFYNNEISFSVRVYQQEPEINFDPNLPERFILNEDYKINSRLWNYGFETARNTAVELYVMYNWGERILISKKEVGDLKDIEKKVSFDWTPDKIGQGYLIFNVSYDYSGGSKSSEQWYWRKVTSLGADLSVWFYADNVETGTATFARISIENSGTEQARNVTYSIYDNENLIKKDNIGSLEAPPSTTSSREIEVPWIPSGIGLHDLRVEIECENDVDLSNNEDTRSIYVYKLKDVRFEITNSTGGYATRYLGLAPKGGMNEINLITEPKTYTIPDIETDIYIIKTENMTIENSKYAITRFEGSALHNMMFTISEDYENARTEGNKRLYRIYANEVFWSYKLSEINFNYPDYNELGANPENLIIYYCSNWDFESEICLSGWKEPNWINKQIEGTRIYMGTIVDSSNDGAEAFAIGEPLVGSSYAEIKEEEKIDFSRIIKEYKNKQILLGREFSSTSSNYQINVNGFFYNCPSSTKTNVDVLFNGELIGTQEVDCYNTLPPSIINEYLGGHTGVRVKNITLNFDNDLVFFDSNRLIDIEKDWISYPLSNSDSTGTEILQVNSFGSDDESEFIFENKNYSYFVVNAISSGNLTNLDVYVNDQPVWEFDLSNSNGKKGRGFEIPQDVREESEIRVKIKSKNPGDSIYLASVKMKTDFDSYYLTIFASPDAIPFEYSEKEADFQKYGSLDEDREGEFSVGRIMGITSSDVSSYLSRVLFYDKISKENEAVMMMVGDSYSQGIPIRTCGTSFCKCYFDTECDELFDKYNGFFDTFETCNQDLINGVPQEPQSNCGDEIRLKNALYNSSLSVYADHGSSTGWPGLPWGVSSSNLEDLPLQIGYSFACSTCSYSNTKADLFCTNMIRRGATGYIGAVESMYGHHFLNEFLDETLINNKSIGYAFKIGKNKEARYDWGTKNTVGSEYLRDMYGIHDILIGDPTFIGGFGK